MQHRRFDVLLHFIQRIEVLRDALDRTRQAEAAGKGFQPESQWTTAPSDRPI